VIRIGAPATRGKAATLQELDDLLGKLTTGKGTAEAEERIGQAVNRIGATALEAVVQARPGRGDGHAPCMSLPMYRVGFAP